MYLPLFLCLYESFSKGFESDQRLLTLLVIKCVCQPRSQGSLLRVLRRAGRREPWERGSAFACLARRK